MKMMNKMLNHVFPLPAAWLRRAVLSLCITLTLTGCGSGGNYSTSMPYDGKLFDQASRAFMECKYNEAARLFRMHGERDPSSRAEAICWEGMCLLETGSYAKAERLFNRSLAIRGQRRVMAMAVKGKARVLFLQGDYVAAEAEYARLSLEYKNETDEAEIMAAMANCRLKRGDNEGASRIMRNLSQQFPHSPYRNSIKPSSGSTATYIVQVGVFNDYGRAQNMVRKLKRSGFESFISSRLVSGKKVYAIQAGAFSTREAAQGRAATLTAKGFPAIVK